MPKDIHIDGGYVDLSARFAHSATVVASPSAATETIVASVTTPGDIAIVLGVYVVAVINFTVGGSGVSSQVKLRRTNVSGTTFHDTGATTSAAASLQGRVAAGIDTGGAAGTVYVATLTVASAVAASTVSSVSIACFGI
jgi:hypothetical protein